MFAINGRFKGRRISGVERYAHEVSTRLKSKHTTITPDKSMAGITGHAWEQFVLPAKLKGRLLWSPCNTGPFWIRNHVVTIHDLIVLDYPEWFQPRFARLYRALIPRIVASARHIITVSEYSKSRIAHWFPHSREKVTVIPNGVSNDFQQASPEAVEQAKWQLKLSEQPYLLTVSSLEPRKNQSGVLEAWRKVSQDFKDVSLIIAGNRSKAVFAATNPNHEVDRVIYTGYVPAEHLTALYSGALGFLYPSLCEGFGLPVLEALACGTQVISSNTSALRELASPHIHAVNPESLDEIAQAMTEMIERGPLRLADKKQASCFARAYSWDQTALATEKILLANI